MIVKITRKNVWLEWESIYLVKKENIIEKAQGNSHPKKMIAPGWAWHPLHPIPSKTPNNKREYLMMDK